MIPVYILDIRDLAGNIYYQEGLAIKAVKYSLADPNNPTPGDPSSSGAVLGRSLNYGYYMFEVSTSGLYDIYIHRPDIGFTILRSSVFIFGADYDIVINRKQALRVGAGLPAINTKMGSQIISFPVANWDSSVMVYENNNKVSIQSYFYDLATGSIKVSVIPTPYAANREFIEFQFYKENTKELVKAYAFSI